MRAGKLLDIIGEIQEDYVEEAYPRAELKRGRRQELEAMPWVGAGSFKKMGAGCRIATRNGQGEQGMRKKGRRRKRFIIMTAGCLCLAAVAVGILAWRSQKYVPSGKFLQSIRAGGFLENPGGYVVHDLVLYPAYVKVGDRMAEYHREYLYGIEFPEIPQMDITSNKLRKEVGKLYQEMDENGRNWYRVKGCDDLGKLISKEKNGLLRLWSFDSFLVGPTPEERVEGIYYTVDKYPGADISPYTYGEMLSLIYGLESAAEVESITAKAQKTNSTPLGIQMQEEVGSHTYVNREQVERIFDVIAGAVYEERKVATKENRRFQYSFTASEELKLSGGGNSIYGSRDLVIRTVDGREIDFLKYDAHMGYIYQSGGIGAGYLDDGAVEILNGIFGIE